MPLCPLKINIIIWRNLISILDRTKRFSVRLLVPVISALYYCCARFHDSVHLEIARGPFRDREIAQPSRDWLVLLCQYNFVSRTRTRFCSLFANKID